MAKKRKKQTIRSGLVSWTIDRALKIKTGDQILVQPKDRRRKPIPYTVTGVYR